jgi:ribosomal protein S18 acetylase RimI-like enzyme
MRLDLDPPGPVALRTVTDADADRLRRWKNAHREAFFFRGEITPQMQREWLLRYHRRPDDLMFVVECDGLAVGCMGFRLQEGEVDVYNVIRGREDAGAPGAMGRAMGLMCSYICARHPAPVRARVVRGNPALAWYRRQGFRVEAEREDHTLVVLDRERFSPVAFTVVADERSRG